jgi:hypothetical protein
LAGVAAIAGLACGEARTPPAASPPSTAPAAAPAREWIDEFDLAKRTLGPTGRNDFFILEPGFQLILADDEDQVAITVLDETKMVNGVEVRVVEEKEWEKGKLVEVSRNFFAIDRATSDLFYFGEEVDDYENGRITGHGGAWAAGESGARAGLILPGTPSLGFRHYQEIAPGVALDRAEIVAMDATLECPAGEFKNCVKVVETTELEPGSSSTKLYARGVGLVFDDGMVLIDSGTGRKSPRAPMAAPAGIAKAMSEVEVEEADVPAPALATVTRPHPDGTIKEVKRETHDGDHEIYAIEVMVGGDHYDVEVAPDGAVLHDEKE